MEIGFVADFGISQSFRSEGDQNGLDQMSQYLSTGAALPVDLCNNYELASANDIYMLRNRIAYLYARVTKHEEMINNIRDGLERMREGFINLSDEIRALDEIVKDAFVNGNVIRRNKNIIAGICSGLSPIAWSVPVIGPLFGAALMLAPEIYSWVADSQSSMELKEQLAHQRFLIMDNLKSTLGNESDRLSIGESELVAEKRRKVATYLSSLDERIHSLEETIFRCGIAEYSAKVYSDPDDLTRCMIIFPIVIDNCIRLFITRVNFNDCGSSVEEIPFNGFNYPDGVVMFYGNSDSNFSVFKKDSKLLLCGNLVYMSPPEVILARINLISRFTANLSVVSSVRLRRVLLYLFLHQGRVDTR